MIANARLRQLLAKEIKDEYTNTNADIYVYSGTMPTTQTDVDNWTAGGYASQLICTFTGFTLKQETNALDNLIFDTFPTPATVTSTNTATADATWYVLHSTTTVPPDSTSGTGHSYFIIGTVSAPGGNGSFQIDTVTNIAPSTNITAIDFNIRVARG